MQVSYNLNDGLSFQLYASLRQSGPRACRQRMFSCGSVSCACWAVEPTGLRHLLSPLFNRLHGRIQPDGRRERNARPCRMGARDSARFDISVRESCT